MKTSKIDRERSSQVNGADIRIETGPLFPRLHVSDTEKAGPRAPPRNKMALFEQFTVPCNPFLQQPSRASTGNLNQQQQHSDNRNPYMASYTPSVPFSTIISSCPQPSHGISSCVTSTVTDQRSQRSSSIQACVTSRPVVARAKQDGSIRLSSLLESKANVVPDSNIPMQSSPRSHSKDAREVLYASSVFENICGKYVLASPDSAKIPTTAKSKNDLPETMSIPEDVVSCSMVESEGCDHNRAELNGSMEVSNTMQIKRVALKSCPDAHNKQSQGPSSFGAEPCKQGDNDCDQVLPEKLMLPIHDLGECASNTDLKSSGYTDDHSSSPPENYVVGNTQSPMRAKQLSGSVHACDDAHKLCSSDGDANAGGLLADNFLKHKVESTGNSQNNQMGSNEMSDISQQGITNVSDDSPLSVLAEQSIKPKDVIRAIGQQQFWKARKALLRQQHIFSDQVFQLHKLIKVQRLLAETPGTLIDEKMTFGIINHHEASPSNCNTSSRGQHRDGWAYATDSFKGKRVKDQADKTRNQQESMQNPESCAAVRNHGMGSGSYWPAFNPGGVSAWGYPSLGMGQWMGPVPAQGKPSPYQPFPGVFPPGTAYGGLYGPVLMGPLSPMVPFSIPYTGQRSEPREEMSSNDGSPEASTCHPQAAPVLGHVAHDLSGAWQFVQYSNSYNYQRNVSAVEKNTSKGCEASLNHRRSVKPSQASGMQHVIGEASHAGRLNNNGLENSLHQSENSAPSCTSNSKCKSTDLAWCAPAASLKAGCHLQQTEQPAQNINSDSVFQTFSSSTQQHDSNGGFREEASKVTLRWPECEQGDQVPFNNENTGKRSGRPFDYSGSMLALFPLVPSLSSDGEHDSFKKKEADWQGRVIKAVPHPPVAASESTAGILLSLQRERQQ